MTPDVVLLAASTGGPTVLASILAAIPPFIDVPIVVVQHATSDHATDFVAWISRVCPWKVELVDRRLPLTAGKVYLAPPHLHVTISRSAIVPVSPGDTASAMVPSIDLAFESAASVFGSRALAILCTGDGHDGSRGCSALRAVGATTIAQSPMTCIAPEMPNSAIAASAVNHVLTPIEIISFLHMLVEDERKTELPSGQ